MRPRGSLRREKGPFVSFTPLYFNYTTFDYLPSFFLCVIGDIRREVSPTPTGVSIGSEVLPLLDAHVLTILTLSAETTDEKLRLPHHVHVLGSKLQR